MSGSRRCPLCRTSPVRPFARVQGRRYLECARCGLIHLFPGDRLSSSQERQRYDLHENDPADPDYREFLDRLAAPLIPRLEAGAQGLDYGSGPGPTLSVMLRERGFDMRIYDPVYAPDERVLQRRYDFVTCTETVEHFFSPRREIEGLHNLLRPGGLLAIMTSLFRPDQDFATWHYVRDPTHACFYRPHTMNWIAGQFDWSMEAPRADVRFFQRPPENGPRA